MLKQSIPLKTISDSSTSFPSQALLNYLALSVPTRLTFCRERAAVEWRKSMAWKRKMRLLCQQTLRLFVPTFLSQTSNFLRIIPQSRFTFPTTFPSPKQCLLWFRLFRISILRDVHHFRFLFHLCCPPEQHIHYYCQTTRPNRCDTKSILKIFNFSPPNNIHFNFTIKSNRSAFWSDFSYSNAKWASTTKIFEFFFRFSRQRRDEQCFVTMLLHGVRKFSLLAARREERRTVRLWNRLEGTRRRAPELPSATHSRTSIHPKCDDGRHTHTNAARVRVCATATKRQRQSYGDDEDVIGREARARNHWIRDKRAQHVCSGPDREIEWKQRRMAGTMVGFIYTQRRASPNHLGMRERTLSLSLALCAHQMQSTNRSQTLNSPSVRGIDRSMRDALWRDTVSLNGPLHLFIFTLALSVRCYGHLRSSDGNPKSSFNRNPRHSPAIPLAIQFPFKLS